MGCIVDTITLSKEQKAQADKRIAAAGLSETVRVHLCDYRELPASFEHSFDACISCEMLEVSKLFARTSELTQGHKAVGYKNYGVYFQTIDWALKKDRATVVISSTTQPEFRYTEHQLRTHYSDKASTERMIGRKISLVDTTGQTTLRPVPRVSSQLWTLPFPESL
jgi:cyclopropane-fatty-acyl-phospholipid synthase